jgi:hypothetical protein
VRIEAGLSAAAHAKEIDHPTLIGAIREIIVRDLLRPILPPSIGVGTGKIVDHVGAASAQIDIILYDRSLLPPLLYGAAGEPGVFPVEACIYAIQVKSTSSAQNLDGAVEQGRSLGGLTYLREACGPTGNPLNRVIPVYFAFWTDLAAPTSEQEEVPEITRWRNRHSHGDVQYEDAWIDGRWLLRPFPPMRVLCVVGQGYGYYDGHHYSTWKADEHHSEIVAFVTGIANTLLGFATRRLALPFGFYLGGPTQAEAQPEPGSPEADDAILYRLAQTRRRFDANEATQAIFDARLQDRGPGVVLGNVTDASESLARLEEAGAIRRVNRESAGPHEWEYNEEVPPVAGNGSSEATRDA